MRADEVRRIAVSWGSDHILPCRLLRASVREMRADRRRLAWFLAMVLGCEQAGTTGLPGAGSRCSAALACPAGLLCVRDVCVPDDEAPLPSASPSPSATPTPTPTPSPTPTAVPRDAIFSALRAPIALFESGSFLLVVDTETVWRLDADGRVVGQFTPGRVITSAAFDGEYLAVADRAIVTALSPALVEISRTELTEYCSSSVMMDGHRFVCGPDSFWRRVFSTIDLVSGTIVGRSVPYSGEGDKMMRVPGRSDFITFADYDPPRFSLFEMRDTVAAYVGRSPVDRSIPFSSANAFTASPSTHMVTTGGSLLRVRGEGCGVPEVSLPECLSREGDLGLLPLEATYLALTQDGQGQVFGLWSSAPQPNGGPACSSEAGCLLDHIDVSARRLVERLEYREHVEAVHAMVYQPAERRVVIVARTDGASPGGRIGYSLRTISLGSP